MKPQGLLVLIPARAGSKRLPGKNLLPLHGRPLVDWSLQTAKVFFPGEKVLLSSDSDHILARATLMGLPHSRRPEGLAGDQASSIDLLRYELGVQEAHQKVQYRGVVLLQPTSPYRSSEAMHAFVKHIRDRPGDMCVAIRPGHGGDFILEGGVLKRVAQGEGNLSVVGSHYYFPRELLLTNENFSYSGAVPLVLRDRFEIVDIDTKVDFEVALAIDPKEAEGYWHA